MKHITYTCDKCGKRMDRTNEVLNIDLCDKCHADLQAMVERWLNNEEETKRIDDGKIGALRRAGWTIKAIAEEIGCSQPTIINHLKAMGIEKGVEA